MGVGGGRVAAGTVGVVGVALPGLVGAEEGDTSGSVKTGVGERTPLDQSNLGQGTPGSVKVGIGGGDTSGSVKVGVGGGDTSGSVKVGVGSTSGPVYSAWKMKMNNRNDCLG